MVEIASMKSLVAIIVVALARPSFAQDLLLRNATVIDGTGASLHELLLMITDGRVVLDRLYPSPYDVR